VRKSALVYFTDGGRVIIIASNLGSRRNPGWYHNIKANPTVTLYGRGINGAFVAEEVTGTERDRLYRRATQVPSPYASYEEASARYIPVVAFSPA
jgi:deazaflavin-dependent oxidoreductase (nitroreductase family)